MQNVDRTEQEALETGLKITTKNASRFLEYHEGYGVLICVHHGYAVRNLADHLKKTHNGSKKERSEVVKLYNSLLLRHARDVPLPPPLEAPFASLGKPLGAFICSEPECQYISASRKGMRLHCNQQHDWTSSAEEREHWSPAWVQTFFKSAGLQRYFTVLYNEEESNPEQTDDREATLVVRSTGNASTASAREEADILALVADWKEHDKKVDEELETADAKTAKTDHTLWFKKTGWTEHVAGCNLRHLSQASRLPDRDEDTLRKAVVLNAALIEKCVAGLSSLDNETRRWLRSAKHSEIDQRPLSRLQNVESQQTYAVYMARLLCYSLRVLRSCDDSERLGESEGGDNIEESDNESGSESHYESDKESDSDGESNSRLDSQPVVDVFKDARKLYPWQGGQKELLRRVRESVENGWDRKSQEEALLEFYKSLIFQRVRGDTFKSAILHFLAVLGINEETRRLRQANDFSYMLAGVVYCARVIAVEVILPSGEREDQGDEDDERFKQERDKYLADGTYSVMSKALSMLAYGKSIAMNHGNAGAISWSDDRKVMSYKGREIDAARFGVMVRGVVEEAKDRLWRHLMWARTREERFEVSLEQLQDDVTWTKRGVSFVDNANNGLKDKREWMIRRALADPDGKKMFKQGTREWSRMEVQKYLRRVDRFRELLLFCVHVTGGQPARGSEITSIRFRNGFQQDRNVFAIQGHIVVVTRYHKSQSQFDKPKVIPKFLPWEVGQLQALWQAYVQPFQEHLAARVKGSGRSDHVWANEFGPWGTDRLTKVMDRETSKRLGVRLTTLDYRHVAVGLGREKVGEQFSRGYVADSVEVEEPEMEEDDPLEMSAGRGGEIGANRYAVSLDVIKHLSSRSIDTFRPLCQKWHEFLGLASYGKRGEKRRMQSSSGNAGSVYSQSQHTDEWRAAMMARNGVSGWVTAMGRIGEQARMQSSEEGRGSDGSWWFGGGGEVTATPSLQSEGELPTGLGLRGQTTPQTQQFSQQHPQQFMPVQQWQPFSQQNSQQYPQQFTPVQHWQPFTPGQQWVDEHTRQQQTPQIAAGTGFATPSATAYLEESPLFDRSTALSAINFRGDRRIVSEEELKRAMRKALRRDDVSYRSEAQKEALQTIVAGEQATPLIVVLPTGGGKSLLFTAPACLDDPGVTIVVVPYRPLLNDLVEKAKKAKIDCMEYRPGEQNPAALVFVSADFVTGTQFLSYGQQLGARGVLRRVLVDESHLAFTSSDWRPKLAGLRAVRGLKAPTIMLTATLPVLLEFELEASMAAQMARYIRASTTRPKTRYIVEACKRGKVEERVLGICRRMEKHLGLRKGVVYSRSRDQCELLARELKSAYYHAGAVDNEERLEAWLERGGLIVATSALGTGVDFPGIVFTLHADIPYGMIDFAQESGRGGRAGEDVDSVIVVEEGKAERRLAGGAAGSVDEGVVGEFIATKGCRRRVMSLYFDDKLVECDDDASMAKCDRCGEGLTAVERHYAQAASERQAVEETLDEVAGGCVWCFADGAGADWTTHQPEECEWSEGGRRGGLDERFRELIAFEEGAHSCFKCGFSQKLCGTGEGEHGRCQWPNVAAALLRSIPPTRQGAVMVRKVGFEGETGNAKEYGKWLGWKHKRRVWGELMSNATALIIEFIVERARRESVSEKEKEEKEREPANEITVTIGHDESRDGRNEARPERAINRGESTKSRHRSAQESNSRGIEAHGEKRRRLGKKVVESTAIEGGRVREISKQNPQSSGRTVAQAADDAVSAVVRSWEVGCIVCRAKGRRPLGHAWESCSINADDTEAVEKGVEMLGGVEGPFRRHGFRRWARGESCKCRVEELRGGCSGSVVVQHTVAALIFGRSEVREWVEEQEAFTRSIEEGKDSRSALEELLSKKWTYEGESQAGLDAFLVRWAV